MKNQGNVSPPSEYSKTPVNDPSEMAFQELPDKEFKMFFQKMQKNTDKQFNDVKKTI